MKLPSAYQPKDYEAKIYDVWEKSRVFAADPHSDKPHFSISMPPPNETGTLHLGQALGLTLQDILGRRARQMGCDVLLLHGTDHAALPVNMLMEKQLAEQGKTKHDIGREEFLHLTRQFVGSKRDTINSQVKAMGTGVDWSRLRYTLDNTLNLTVNAVFVKMYHDGLIYRGNRIVNWDPKLETTVSDDEVDYVEQTEPLYTLKFGPFEIATARPETKFGDKYVVMHPNDARYKQYKHGDTFELEWLNGKLTATVIKDEAIDPEFGTGVMTITPWHDRTDFEIAERHGLEKEQIIDFKGRLLPIAGEFAQMSIAEARPKIVEKLNRLGLLLKAEERQHAVAVNSRGKGVIEPQIMLQWFVDVNRPAVEWKGQKRSFKEVMRAVVEDSDIKLHPKRYEQLYFHWIDNLRDWCISRQIWWGHQIPAWRAKGSNDEYRAFRNSGEAKEQLGTEEVERDPDTLDTWFSSALWTWSTLLDQDYVKTNLSKGLNDWLENSADFKAYHPTSVMETAWDILFFWVARMILSTTYVTGQVPFRNVYLHGLLRTPSGKKMSKSDPESNIDPLDMISEYGTDALRLALAAGATAGNDQKLGREDIVVARNFCNKLWNIARFVESKTDQASGEALPKSSADHWILNKLSILTDELDQNMASFRFHEAYDNLYHFVWDDLADWYIETSKSDLNASLLQSVLKNTLVLLHPFAPFITEAIWQELGFDADGILAAQLTPKSREFEVAEVKKFEKQRADIMAKRAPDQIKKLNSQRQLLEQGIKVLRTRLANKDYVAKAPAEIIENTKNELEAQQKQIEEIDKVLEILAKL